MISKSISTSTKLAEVGTFAKLLFTWAIPHCDDLGHIDATPKILKGIVVPLCDESIEDVSKAIEELEKAGLIRRYEAEGRMYITVSQWEKHQTLRADRPLYIGYPRDTTDIPKGNHRDTTGKPRGAKRHRKLSEDKLSEVKRSIGGRLENAPPTPKEQAIAFFKGIKDLITQKGETEEAQAVKGYLQSIVEHSKADKETIWKEAKEFTRYWTERNKSGTRERWEQQATFEVGLRFANWIRKVGMKNITNTVFSKQRGKEIIGL